MGGHAIDLDYLMKKKQFGENGEGMDIPEGKCRRSGGSLSAKSTNEKSSTWATRHYRETKASEGEKGCTQKNC